MRKVCKERKTEKDSCIDPSFIRASDRLVSAIGCMGKFGLSFDGKVPVPVQTSSVKAAQSFLRALTPECTLPQVAPDGEGGVLMVWESAGFFLTFDQWRLHALVGPGTSNIRHVDDVPFYGDFIPVEILCHIPLRRK